MLSAVAAMAGVSQAGHLPIIQTEVTHLPDLGEDCHRCCWQAVGLRPEQAPLYCCYQSSQSAPQSSASSDAPAPLRHRHLPHCIRRSPHLEHMTWSQCSALEAGQTFCVAGLLEWNLMNVLLGHTAVATFNAWLACMRILFNWQGLLPTGWSPGLIFDTGKLLGAACMQAVLEEEDRYVSDVTYRDVQFTSSGFQEAGKACLAISSSSFLSCRGVCAMLRVVVIPNQSRCVKMILSQRIFSEGGCEVVWCSMAL